MIQEIKTYNKAIDTFLNNSIKSKQVKLRLFLALKITYN